MSEKNVELNTIATCDGRLYLGKIETDFTHVVAALPPMVQNRYEQDILENGIQKSLNVWITDTDPERYIMIDGHLEYEMAQKYGLPFNITLRKFANRDEVICFIIKSALYRPNLSTFQKCEMVLPFKGILTRKGKENMQNGGKGVKIPEKVDTMVELGLIIGISHDTCRKAQFIINSLDDNDERLALLRDGEISINSVHEQLTGKKKNKKKDQKDFFSNFEEEANEVAPSSDGNRKIVIRSKFHIDESDKFSVLYIRPKWNLSNSISLPDTYIPELVRMNIKDIVYHKFCSLLIHTPSKYMHETIKMIEGWGFRCVDSICIVHRTSQYSSKYSNQNHEFLLICALDVAEIPNSFIKQRAFNSIIDSENVTETIIKMFDDNLAKACIFTEPLPGWDSFPFDSESNVETNHNKAA